MTARSRSPSRVSLAIVRSSPERRNQTTPAYYRPSYGKLTNLCAGHRARPVANKSNHTPCKVRAALPMLLESSDNGPRESPEGCSDPGLTRSASPVPCARAQLFSGRIPRVVLPPKPSRTRWCRHRDVPEPQETTIPPHFSAPFDREIGLQFTELSPDGARAQLEVTPKLLQPMGLVHGGVYCSMIESMASVAAYTWLATRGGGNVVGSQQQHRLPPLHRLRHGVRQGRTDPPGPEPAVVVGHHHRRRRPRGRPGAGAPAESGASRG